MRKMLLTLLIIAIFVLSVILGVVVYNERKADFLMDDNMAAARSSGPPRQFISENLPLQATVKSMASYQKPAEDAVVKLPVFNYHHIRSMPNVASSTITDRAFTVSPEGFEAHLRYLRDNGYKTVLPDDLADFFDTGAPLPSKAVMITFDDGRYGQYQWAYFLLKRYGMKAAFFITTNWIGRPDFMTWEQIKEMNDNGMTIGSHAMSHPHLSALVDADLSRELTDSKKIIEEKIGRKIDYFAYPGGAYDARVIEAVKTVGYRAATGVYQIIEQSPKYRYAIRRFHADDALASIAEKLKDY